ncbi:MAG TPA: nucleotidyltransferase [Archaeoglobaceae archaeon]|nr:nucleotidyltransferase [Archaeoglobaceae archaeon]
MRGKTAIFGNRKTVTYNSNHWKLLEKKRRRAVEVAEKIADFSPVLYGSVARGDVTELSDIDLFIPESIPSYRIEVALDSFEILKRRIIQATPNYAIKGEFVLEDETTVSFPLVRIKQREMDFYKFGGAVSFDELLRSKRVPGVDKRLVMILPKNEGHDEIPLNEMQINEISKILNIGIEIIEERIRVLERRREIGRTGVFLCEEISPDESFESRLKLIAKKNPNVKRRLMS